MLAHSIPLWGVVMILLWIFGLPLAGLVSLVLAILDRHRAWAAWLAAPAVLLGFPGMLMCLAKDGAPVMSVTAGVGVLCGGVSIARLLRLDRRRRDGVRSPDGGSKDSEP